MYTASTSRTNVNQHPPIRQDVAVSPERSNARSATSRQKAEVAPADVDRYVSGPSSGRAGRRARRTDVDQPTSKRRRDVFPSNTRFSGPTLEKDLRELGDFRFPEHRALPPGLSRPSCEWSDRDMEVAKTILRGEPYVSRFPLSLQSGWAGGGAIFVPGVSARQAAERFAMHEWRSQWLPHMPQSFDHGERDIDPGEGVDPVTLAEYRMEPLGFFLRHLHQPLRVIAPALAKAGAYHYKQFESERRLHDAAGNVIGYSFEWRVPTDAEREAIEAGLIGAVTLAPDLVSENDKARERADHQEEAGSATFTDLHGGCLFTYTNLTRIEGWKTFVRQCGKTGLPERVDKLGWSSAEYYYKKTLEGLVEEMRRARPQTELNEAKQNFENLLASPHVKLVTGTGIEPHGASEPRVAAAVAQPKPSPAPVELSHIDALPAQRMAFGGAKAVAFRTLVDKPEMGVLLFTLQPGEEIPAHVHDCAKAIYVSSGNVEVLANGRMTATVPGDSLHTPRRSVTRVRNVGDTPAEIYFFFPRGPVSESPFRTPNGAGIDRAGTKTTLVKEAGAPWEDWDGVRRNLSTE